MEKKLIIHKINNHYCKKHNKVIAEYKVNNDYVCKECFDKIAKENDIYSSFDEGEITVKFNTKSEIIINPPAFKNWRGFGFKDMQEYSKIRKNYPNLSDEEFYEMIKEDKRKRKSDSIKRGLRILFEVQIVSDKISSGLYDEEWEYTSYNKERFSCKYNSELNKGVAYSCLGTPLFLFENKTMDNKFYFN